ncbi:uncharacterized protein LOC119682301 [Teleopsis dalmanni]|uniref:uncharacterized protein LOC119682301 n=1 Tax=Teleopsis dalmanni TaxID=139649 RepID=UPI0018CDECA6|nr:uncharacterized protein LOC119682301 [Teleopsis dalmanni]
MGRPSRNMKPQIIRNPIYFPLHEILTNDAPFMNALVQLTHTDENDNDRIQLYHQAFVNFYNQLIHIIPRPMWHPLHMILDVQDLNRVVDNAEVGNRAAENSRLNSSSNISAEWDENSNLQQQFVAGESCPMNSLETSGMKEINASLDNVTTESTQYVEVLNNENENFDQDLASSEKQQHQMSSSEVQSTQKFGCESRLVDKNH